MPQKRYMPTKISSVRKYVPLVFKKWVSTSLVETIDRYAHMQLTSYRQEKYQNIIKEKKYYN